MNDFTQPLPSEVSGPNQDIQTNGGRSPGASSRPSLLLIVVPLAVVLITFLFWYETWFGRPLSSREMTAYLTDTSAPHHTQHALSQLADRMARGDPSARQWYPEVVALAGSKEAEFRVMAAWVMGQDNTSAVFHSQLRKLLSDRDPMVEWNAALSLVRFKDDSGEPELRAMLEPYALHAPVAGTLRVVLKPNQEIERGSVVAQIKSGGRTTSVTSPLAGRVGAWSAKDGEEVGSGEPLVVLTPGDAQVWESLRALYLAGGKGDLSAVERFAQGVPGYSDKIRAQAELTAQAIRQREAKPAGTADGPQQARDP